MTEAKSKRKGICQVGRDEFHRSSDMGPIHAATHLCIATGSGPDNITSSWSALSVEKYAGIDRRKVKPVIQDLINAGILELSNDPGPKGHPRYKIAKGEEVIHLPNYLVTGNSEEGQPSPLEVIWQTGDDLLLRLFIDLYYYHHLETYGGINPELFHRRWQLVGDVGETGQYRAVAFEPSPRFFAGTGPEVEALLRPHASEADAVGRLRMLHDLGLLEFVPTIINGTSPTDKQLHTVHLDSRIPEEATFAAAVATAGNVIAKDHLLGQAELSTDALVLPVLRHHRRLCVIDVLRLVCRPHTEPTTRWMAKLYKTIQSHKPNYTNIVQVYSWSENSKTPATLTPPAPQPIIAFPRKERTSRHLPREWMTWAMHDCGLDHSEVEQLEGQFIFMNESWDASSSYQDKWKNLCYEAAPAPF